MATLTDQRIEEILRPYLQTPISQPSVEAKGSATATQAPLTTLIPALSLYLDLLLRWNERTNLTSIRDPEQIVARHFGESLFAARVLASRLANGSRILDLGSGAGFPGLPLQLALPEMKVTLAESQGKKSAFLREAVRATAASAEVWTARAQELPPMRRFDAVTLRAVDRPEQALAEAWNRIVAAGYVLHLCGAAQAEGEAIPLPGLSAGVIDVLRA